MAVAVIVTARGFPVVESVRGYPVRMSNGTQRGMPIRLATAGNRGFPVTFVNGDSPFVGSAPGVENFSNSTNSGLVAALGI